MRKTILVVLLASCVILLSACSISRNDVKTEVKGNMQTYYEMENGTWMCNGLMYQYRLEISDRMPNAAKDISLTYLSNIQEISFKKAYMAAGLSSNLEDYFKPEEAILVNME